MSKLQKYNMTTSQKLNREYDNARIAFNKWLITLEELNTIFTKISKNN